MRRGRPGAPDNWIPPRIAEVRDGSPCDGIVKPGDLLLELAGTRPLDILDYLEACGERRISLRLSRNGREVARRVRKHAEIPLGLVFEEAVFDGVHTCRNRCIFCFVDQLPAGLRSTLYEKDDDYRLSFYYGNFVTLNNLSRADEERIMRLRLMPLYVSLHSTDPFLRSRLMGGEGGKGLSMLERLLHDRFEIHLQVVICPGINDGEELRRTFQDVMTTYPAASLGVVPVGLTARDGLPHDLSPCDGTSAQRVLELVEEYQGYALGKYGRRIFYASDEFYILAGRDFPAGEEYEEFPQLENGVGMARKFIDEALGEYGATGQAVPYRGVITGMAGEKVLCRVMDEACPGGVEVLAVPNLLMGGTVTVTALLGGADIIAALRERKPAARELLMPESMLRDGSFVDDLTPRDVERDTGYRLLPVEVNGAGFVRALYEKGRTD
ncbi:MAG: DUF512 domain-containing protein [Actinobacteria bacterium]|jgi:putative radical SAM enzyme (TIGR03279 family)|nr:MAG: DUF512 domain-containing protein [Actinomycetota bacterium]